MAEVRLTITNLPQIRAAFSKAPRLMAQNLNLAIKRSAFIIATQSSLNAPVRTGFLRRSHFLPGAIVLENLRGIISPQATYAIYVHEGTRYMRSRPFLLQAVQSKRDVVQKEFTHAVQATLNEIAKGTQ